MFSQAAERLIGELFFKRQLPKQLVDIKALLKSSIDKINIIAAIFACTPMRYLLR